MSPYPAEVARLIEDLLAGVRGALADNLVGVYLRGSLALGDFDPENSDVDILVVTERPVSDAEFAALAALHARIPAAGNQYGRHYEASYVDRASLKRFQPGERRHPTVGSDWVFQWAEHRDNFILERWMVREHGVALSGPDPKTLIDPISPDDLRSAVASELQARMEHWASGNETPKWLGPRYYQAFEIETICRALFTLEFGELPTKRQAVAWALGALPEPWRALIEWSQEHRADKAEDPSMIADVMRFVRWAASEAKLDANTGLSTGRS